MSAELAELIVCLGSENRSWGWVRIQGELLKLGIRAGATSVQRVLRRHGLGPVPRRGPTWKEFLRAQAKPWKTNASSPLVATGPAPASLSCSGTAVVVCVLCANRAWS
jgi:hypothetical protein